MNIGIFLGHPAHFHNLKNVAKNLQNDGHNVFFAIKEKDILEQLMQNAGFTYTKLREGRGASRLSQIKSVIGMECKMIKFIHDYKIDLMLGSSLSFATSMIMHKPAIIVIEDDALAVPLYAKIVLPFATEILTPDCCDNWRWNNKSIKYPSYQEFGYLHPNNFSPSKDIVKKYGIDADAPYFIIRFSSLNAHHDKGIKGISNEVAQHIITMLRPHGNIYITSERPLDSSLDQYRIHINPLDIHHVMAFASMYIGDSQTMAAESGVLGTPFVRLNDFVGRLSYIHELEAPTDYSPRKNGYIPMIDAHVPDDKHYCLGYGHKAADIEGFYRSINKWLNLPNRKDICAKRRQHLLEEKIDYAKFLTWFIEHYPSSAEESRINKGNVVFWNQFR